MDCKKCKHPMKNVCLLGGEYCKNPVTIIATIKLVKEASPNE